MEHDQTELKMGDLVEVMSEAEIRATLDSNGALEGLPFMPEMASFCGRTFRVYKHATATCVEGVGVKAMSDTLFLEGVRCDGGFHDGCQRLCVIFWKRQWLRKVSTPGPRRFTDADSVKPAASAPEGYKTRNGDTYYCQSTELKNATLPFPWWDIRRDLENVRRNGLPVLELARQLLIVVYAKVQRVMRKEDFVRVRGTMEKTPTERLGLQVGEWVEVKTLAEIRATLDATGRNRGLELSAEMVPDCGKRMRVAKRVDKIILEITGKMQSITDSVILEGSSCDGSFHRGCPRNSYFLWREIWLRRVDGGNA